MSLQHVIQTDARSYLVADDATSVYRVLLIGTVQDAVTGGEPFNPLHVAADLEGVRAKLTDNHFFCLAGDETRVLPPSRTSGAMLNVTVSAEGYRTAALELPIPANATFPIQLPAPILLDPLPTRVRGRVMTNAGTPIPIANALVTVVDPTLSPPDHVLVLRSPLRLAHALNTPVRERPLTATGTLKHLLAPAAAANQTLILDQRAGLGVNTRLRLGSGSAIEFAVIESLNPIPANPNLPGEVYLRFPLYRSFAAGSEVTAVTVGAIGASGMLNRSQNQGEALIILNSAFTADTVEIADADPTRVEYHAIGARTGGDGYYTLDGIGRALIAQVRAASGPLNATQAVRLDYQRGVTLVDFAL